MNPSAQNAMLKLLEEGPPYAVFLLIAGNPGGLLQTVRSRCGELALTPPSEPAGDEGGRERQALARKLAAALERGGELELLEAAMALVEAELARRAVQGGGRRRLLRASGLVRELNAAARLNVNGGQLAGWLCAGMFQSNL